MNSPVGRLVSDTLLSSTYTAYPVTTAPLDKPDVVMVTGNHSTVSDVGEAPGITWTSNGASGRPVTGGIGSRDKE